MCRNILKEEDLEKIRKEVGLEFPDDVALQQVHIARKIIAREAEIKGLKYLDYIKLISKDIKATH